MSGNYKSCIFNMHTSQEPVKISSQTNGLAFRPRQNFNENIIYREHKEEHTQAKPCGILDFSFFVCLHVNA